MCKDDDDLVSEKLEELFNKLRKSVTKPCLDLEYCPYGPLVEYFPYVDTSDENTSKDMIEKRCSISGHACPVFFVCEPMTEEPPE